MEEYPRNLTEFEANFGSEEACRAYLARLRWPAGFVCPRCGSAKAWPVRDLWQCAGCGYQTSVTAGTIFQDTRTLLTVWFRAMWWVTTQKNGASALGLQRVLGLKKYETAWTWLHKLRRAMVRPGRDRLTGKVEVDECYVGGLEEGLPGRLNLDKALVVVAAQEDGPGIGRIRMRQIIDASAESLMLFMRDSVEAGSVVHTDGWLGYLPLECNGYLHEVTFLKGKSRCSAEDTVRRYKSLAQVERAFRSLKGIDLRIRPIHHRTEDHVRAHIFLCMLAYYVEWHMRRALAPLLFDDEELRRDRARRDPVAPAETSTSAQAKKVSRLTADGLPVQSFRTLLRNLATRCRNTCRIPGDPTGTRFQQLTEATPLQARALQLLGL